MHAVCLWRVCVGEQQLYRAAVPDVVLTGDAGCETSARGGNRTSTQT